MRLASLLIRERSTLVYWVSLLFAPVAAGCASAFGLIAKGWRDDIAASMGVATWVMYFSAGVVASMHLHEMRRETDYRQADATAEYPAPVGMQPVYAAETEQEWQPDIVIIPTSERGGVTIHVAPRQLTELKRRIRDNDLGLPVNGFETLSSTQAKRLRTEAVSRGLAETRGGRVLWTPEGALGVLRSSPAASVSGPI